MPSCLGRTSVAIAWTELALGKGIPESEITRTESYMLIHKPKEMTPRRQELMNSIKNHVAEHLESQNDLARDAVAKGDSLMKKNDGLMMANSQLERRIEAMEVNMDARMMRQMEEVRAMFMSQRGTCTDNVTSPHSRASHQSPSALLGNAQYIGKDCELRGGWPLDIVARGVVQDVDPNTEYGERTLEEGNFKIFVQVVRDHNATLPCHHNGWVRTLGQVVQGGVIWPKELLVFASHSSSS
ncbi:hypothetical protein IFM89_000024 [Coptis chinensis]|uniref:Transposase Tnp1/En/Spm-like domain-containing protein n=1 Tax=Coptis chinensis TaxID=261450 RepID=A0A835IM00_9MAGN|nr:hypothetical protein IFM89_000024 [Coptis chinensis]